METAHHCGTPRILVVDDHEASGQFLLRALARLDAVTEKVETGSAAIDRALSWLPRLILMDIHLPDADGIEIAGRIRHRWPSTQAVAEIVLVSAEAPRTRQQDLDSLDIRHTIVKPVSGPILRSLVTDLLGLAGAGPAPSEPNPEIRALFISELEQNLPVLEKHLLRDEKAQAAFMVHQLIASAAMSGEKRLEETFRKLNRLLCQAAAAAELARVYYQAFQQSQAVLHKHR
jgi:CheY-like chemotaxis protein/HPt (histidine-containing phosphotransfer) domain-containing protein